MRVSAVQASVVAMMILAGTGLAQQTVQDYLYPGDEVLQLAVQLGGQDLEHVLSRAVEELEARGGEDILICSMMKIEAPLEGYLIDGLWSADLEGAVFSSFRIGIEANGSAFVLLARGSDSEGNVLWFPPPGPDWRPEGNCVAPESLLDYEFLLDRTTFEDLEDLYPRPPDEGSH